MRIFDQLRELFSETRDGLKLKLASFLARALLLVAVLPNMLPGELANYMFAATVGLIGGRAILLGVDLELPLSISGLIEKARKFSLGILLCWLLILIAFIVFLIRKDINSAILLLVLTIASNQFLAGTVRTLSPSSFERLINIPMLIFAGAALILQSKTATELLILRALAGCVVQLIVAFQQQILAAPSTNNFKILISEIIKSLQSSWSKLLGSLSLRGALRGFILWPRSFESSNLSDTIAFAVAIGDAIYQLGMVFANRRYSIMAKQPNIKIEDLISNLQTGLALNLIMVILGITSVYALDQGSLLPNYSNISVINQSILFYSIMCLFSLMQFVSWVSYINNWVTIFPQLFLLIAIGIICALSPLKIWFGLASIVAFAVTFCLFTLTMRKIKS
ncbi:MAG: hypothetical protein VYA80_05075 [Pseudomonadota bacterium]|nr:hypothetical protein [Pseudomonadota bacterium]